MSAWSGASEAWTASLVGGASVKAAIPVECFGVTTAASLAVVFSNTAAGSAGRNGATGRGPDVLSADGANVAAGGVSTWGLTAGAACGTIEEAPAEGAIAGSAAMFLIGAATAAVAAGISVAGDACALVTMACGAIEAVSSLRPAGRSISDMTTAAPAVAPIAVATKTTRRVLMKLGAGAR